ncbi:putative WRKY transcription factor 33-like isoform X1 [Hibiscus syriacus]|uniref:WRKY transcription factor 33-like isoform X1 n=1 Tax=Hibiscus syriacus TaxID=106335 RepID=A0A6A3CJU8_HIBSY|nr:putative WRKY transcription factor 33-like isoform X1 [Hibiscus syriacus]
MGNSLRCCLACVLPCGALDLIRIVHLNGHVEEITRSVTAGEILDANPNHVLTKPSSQGVPMRRKRAMYAIESLSARAKSAIIMTLRIPVIATYKMTVFRKRNIPAAVAEVVGTVVNEYGSLI